VSHIGVVRRFAGVLLVVLMAAGCTTSGSHHSAPKPPPAIQPTVTSEPISSVLADPSPAIADHRLSRTWRLDGGTFVAGPAPAHARPTHTQQQAVTAARAADEAFFTPRARTTYPTGPVDLHSAYALVTVSAGLPIGCVEACLPPAALPKAGSYRQRRAWIVWYRIVGPTSCPGVQVSPASPARPAAAVEAHRGWIVFVYPDHLDNAISYRESGAGCGGLPASADLAQQHIGVAWHLISRRGTTVIVGFTPPACGRASFSSYGTDDGTHGDISIAFAVRFGPHQCRAPRPQTYRARIPLTVRTIRDGPVGVLG
jgi:hypothetical protein